jgi:hypothetical protein
MAVWAIVALVVYTFANTTLLRFQRFTLGIARSASDELGGSNPRQVRALHSLMMPLLHTSLSWLCYVVLAVGFVMAFRASGYLGAGFVLVWAVATTAILARNWPLPTTAVCARLAAGEVRRGGKLPHLEPDERELVTKLLLQRLEPLESAAN